MSLSTILLIAVPIALILVMHAVGHGGSHGLGRRRAVHESDELGAERPGEGRDLNGRTRVDRQDGEHQHGRRSGCC